MPFSFSLSDEVKATIRVLAKKDKVRADAINKKIRQIISCDEVSIDHFKNLRNEMSDCKRVHIDKSFVLVFKVSKKEKFILFDKFEHHDKVYKR